MKKIIVHLCLSLLFYFNAIAQVPVADSLALVALYNSTNGTSWTNNTNWLVADQPVSTWYGITVTEDTVSHIELDENNLVGTIPLEIGNFLKLERLYLQGNQLEGSIPDEICNLSYLNRLSLYENLLTGMQ